MTPRTPQKKQRVVLDHDRRETFVSGREIYLPPAEYTILRALISTNKVQTREDLGRALGYDQDYIDMNTRVVDQHVTRLRKRIGAELIATIPTVGYRWDGNKA